MAPGRGRAGPAEPDRFDRGALVHLLYGDETRLRDQRLKQLEEELRPAENREYNQETFVGPDLDLDLVVAACETLPVFADRRLVVVRNLDLRQTAGHAGMVAYLRRPNPTTILVLAAGPTERRGAGDDGEGAEASRAERKGISLKDLMALIPSRVEFAVLTADRAGQFLREAVKARGKTIADDAAAELLELVGHDAARIEDEIEKAALLAGSRPRIEAEDIESLVRRSRQTRIFDLTDAIADGDRAAILTILGRLLAEGAEELQLLGMIAWHYRRTLQVAALVSEGKPPAEIARRLRLPWSGVERMVASARRLGILGAGRAVGVLRRADRDLKSSPVAGRMLLEQALLGLVPAVPARGGPSGARRALDRR